MIRRFFMILAAIAVSTTLMSCAASRPRGMDSAAFFAETNAPVRKIKALSAKQEAPRARPPKDKNLPAVTDLSPLKTRIVSLSLRDSPMKDAVYAIAETTGLNVVMQAGVNPDTHVTISLKGVKAAEALDTILSSVNYFYTLKGNILIIRALDTMVFEMGRPSVIQQYSVNVGGDILGASKTSNSGVTGDVAQKISSDNSAFKFWDTLEKSIKSILEAGAMGGGAEKTDSTLTIDRMTGTIMVTATRGNLRKVERFLTRMRNILNRQVVIEARIMEVKLTDGLKYGIDWSFLGGDTQGFGAVSAGTTKFTDMLANAANFNFTIKGADFTSILKALKEQGDINILSNPRISIMNGQTALLSVGQKVDFVSRVETTTIDTTSGSTPTINFTVETGSILSGIMFGIVPYIGEAGREVTLAITPVVSDLVKLEDKKIGDIGSNSINISLPTVDLKEMSTTVKVESGEMVIIGGLIEKKSSTKDNSVPLLAGVPLIGSVFKSRDRNSSKSELVIMIKPVVIAGAESVRWKK